MVLKNIHSNKTTVKSAFLLLAFISFMVGRQWAGFCLSPCCSLLCLRAASFRRLSGANSFTRCKDLTTSLYHTLIHVTIVKRTQRQSQQHSLNLSNAVFVLIPHFAVDGLLHKTASLNKHHLIIVSILVCPTSAAYLYVKRCLETITTNHIQTKASFILYHVRLSWDVFGDIWAGLQLYPLTVFVYLVLLVTRKVRIQLKTTLW